jgi:hypothetical protein
MTTTTRPHRPHSTAAALALLLAMAIAGCSTRAEPAASTTAPAGSGDRSPLKYSQCMRAQGLAWFPDPDARGNLKVSVPEGTDQSKVENAEQACAAHAPWEGGGSGDPISEADLAKIRQVSQCMRDQGFAKYPDPDANGSVKIDSAVLGAGPDDPAFQKARDECHRLMPTPRNREGS